jgi:hypothetical protein
MGKRIMNSHYEIYYNTYNVDGQFTVVRVDTRTIDGSFGTSKYEAARYKTFEEALKFIQTMNTLTIEHYGVKIYG